MTDVDAVDPTVVGTCKNGHPLTPENVLVSRKTSRGRPYKNTIVCRTCRNNRAREVYFHKAMAKKLRAACKDT